MFRFRFVAFAAVLSLAAAGSAFAAPVPSKTAPDQTVAARQADLAIVHSMAADEQVSKALAAQGFSQDEVNSRIASLSDQDLHSLSQNLGEIQAAGVTRKQWIWIGIGTAAAIIIALSV